MTTAFVLSGGGSLGAVQVGMLQSLANHGVTPDLVVGTSVGALNAVWVGHHGMSPASLDGLESVWSGLRRQDVFPLRAGQLLRGLLGREAALCTAESLHLLVRTHAGIEDLADALIPVHVLATDLLTGGEVLLSAGPVGPSIAASAAVPGVFPPVRLDGRYLVDGAIAGHSGVAQAIDLGATRIYVLPAGVACALTHPPRSAVGVAIHAVSLLVQQRLVAEVSSAAHRAGAPVVTVLPPLCPLRVSATDFTHADELIDRGRAAADAWLDAEAPYDETRNPARGVHDHRSNVGRSDVRRSARRRRSPR